MTVKQSLLMTGFWIFAAFVFAGTIIYPNLGSVATMQFLTVFSLEKLLSMDNLLVISCIFGYFAIPRQEQRKALMYGLAGAVFFRAFFILSGVNIINNFSFMLYFFAAFLIVSGYSMMFEKDGNYEASESKIVQFVNRNFGNLGLFMTCIIAIELSDIAFAVDSIPASFGVSQNSLVILSANLFAVMGLRSLYHAIASGIELLNGIERYIGIILALVGINVFVSHFVIKIPEVYLMTAVFSILCFGVIACKPKKGEA